ncbi:MAG TPA: RNA-binding S4 domain-containing protein [Clostridia bacterium]|nr:RNA-binding S4 domain-containing protein [Clostridia bacterium]
MENIVISTEFIKLSQLLKWAGIADTGSRANDMIAEGLIKLNGIPETRRGKKIYHGDKILLEDKYEFLVIREG